MNFVIGRVQLEINLQVLLSTVTTQVDYFWLSKVETIRTKYLGRYLNSILGTQFVYKNKEKAQPNKNQLI